jgi:molybdopterin molybdotransferase
VYDSNRHTLRCLLQAVGVEAIDMGIVKDTFDDTYKTLKEASEKADVIVSSGGISAGDADYVTKAFHQLGDVAFWKIAMRPGRPLASGKIGGATFFGLPGNPVAVMVTFLAFVQPAIKRRMGMLQTEPMAIPAQALISMKKTPGRTEYQRGIMSVSDNGAVQVTLTGKQGAGRLSSMSVANCLIVLPEQQATVNVGDTVSVWPFEGLLS